MATTPDPVAARRPTMPQPVPPEWSTALLASQRRAADRRAQLARRRSAQQWLRTLARR